MSMELPSHSQQEEQIPTARLQVEGLSDGPGRRRKLWVPGLGPAVVGWAALGQGQPVTG